ncbi:MAG: 2-oxoacid:acceptor oxidoreductase subunit alpha [Patescibacteria group bacterium]|jgi:2-oxoglutarate ferredoxin oxidoreductase subunit alpha
MKHFTLAMGGEAGYGINSTGLSFSKIAVRLGYSVFNYFEYPSIVRGGHTLFRSTFSVEPIFSAYSGIDFLVVLNQESMNRDTEFLNENATILYDSSQVKILPTNVNKYRLIDMPLGKIAMEKGAVLLRDTIALGAVSALLGADQVLMRGIVAEEFKTKSEKVKIQNTEAIEAGYEYAVANFKTFIQPLLIKQKSSGKKIVITGNEAAALGSVAAGMQFAAIYPMTPITNILHTLAPLQKDYQFVFRQPEDEISALNMAIGASFAGVRSMTATGGGGYCLMTEAIGLAGMTETAVVIIEGMRGGPSTGLPTWTEQGDLRFVLHSHQGDIPKIVLAPGDAKEAFEMVFDAFNLADKYQTPVIVMLDKQICESHQSFQPFKVTGPIERGKFSMKSIADYSRYANSEDGISLRAPAGSVNHVVANSDEHDEKGYTNDEAAMRDMMMGKRMRKMDTCSTEDMKGPLLYGPQDAELTIVSWGSTKGAVLEAMKQLPNVNFVHIGWLSPFPSDAVAKELKRAKRLLNVEGNFSAQLGGLITEMTGIRIMDNLLKSDGRPFFPDELVVEINKRLAI